DLESLTDFPVINKNMIRENMSSFLSSEFERMKLHTVTTSGSTGTPFTVYQDRKKRLRHLADSIYFLKKAGFLIGERLYYLRVWNAINKKNFVECFTENLVMEEISNLSASWTKKLINRLQHDLSAKALLAYSSTYEALVVNLVTLGITEQDVHLKAIISMSESLSEPARQRLGEIFKCPVFLRYSNMENGFLGQQISGNSKQYQINLASYHVELLDVARDVPVKAGERGRVVVTDLFNRAMPLIRYDTGDIAVMSQAGLAFEDVEGRATDFIYSTAGSLISPHAITNLMWKYSELKQFQFVQTAEKKYLLKLNPEKKFQRAKELMDEFKQYLGVDANIEIEFVEEIPQLASGKRKKIVNLYRSLDRIKG
ncbi:MAG: hypothetical protein ABTQ25_00490, partial [Nitrosomonas ureae]